MPWPVLTTMCAPSATGEFFFLSHFLNQLSDVSPDWDVCFPGKEKASAGGTNPAAAVCFLPSGENMAWLERPRPLVSQLLMEYLCVFPQHKWGEGAGELPLQRHHQRWILLV